MTLEARIDHLVVVAATLEQGAQWCRSTLGVDPGPGGEHPLMGTHNRLLRIATVDYPRAYFEIIAVQPGKQAQDARRRWFDMDDARLLRAVKEEPQLVHYVASVSDMDASLDALRALDVDVGAPVRASRPTPRGLLEWRITLRDDGVRQFGGGMPALIEWGGTHPVPGMPESGVSLLSFEVSHPDSDGLEAAHAAIGLRGVPVHAGEVRLRATLLTPKGHVKLESRGS